MARGNDRRLGGHVCDDVCVGMRSFSQVRGEPGRLQELEALDAWRAALWTRRFLGTEARCHAGLPPQLATAPAMFDRLDLAHAGRTSAG